MRLDSFHQSSRKRNHNNKSKEGLTHFIQLTKAWEVSFPPCAFSPTRCDALGAWLLQVMTSVSCCTRQAALCGVQVLNPSLISSYPLLVLWHAGLRIWSQAWRPSDRQLLLCTDSALLSLDLITHTYWFDWREDLYEFINTHRRILDSFQGFLSKPAVVLGSFAQKM